MRILKKRFSEWLTPVRVIAIGFLLVIFFGSFLLMLPASVRADATLSYIDALYTSTSAVCVTGLVVTDAGDTFTLFGQIVLAVLIQIGGLGVATVGTGIMLALGRHIDIRGKNLIKEGSNMGTVKGSVRLLCRIFLYTSVIELVGALLCFFLFLGEYPFWQALWLGFFHSIASFNNAGFDIFGGGVGMIPYVANVPLNLITSFLIILGGIGFLVIHELLVKRFRWKKLSMHARIVLSTSGVLIVLGTLLLKATENISWLGAFFTSVSTRTAGFSTYSPGGFSNAGLLVVMALMFIGASSGSTGGGVKTGTFFVLLSGIRGVATNRRSVAFHYSLPAEAFKKATVIVLVAIGVIFLGTFALAVFEPSVSFVDLFFEMISAFGTVGLSTGITPELGTASKLVSMAVMYIGRLGPMTVASLWFVSLGERVRYPEGNLAIG